MTTPVVVVVDDDAAALALVETELRKRYGADYEVVATTSPETALEALRELRELERPVALVLADLTMPGMAGIDLLTAARDLHPAARRVLLDDRHDVATSKAEVVRASVLGQIDSHARKPVDVRDEQFHHVITELLAEWGATTGEPAHPFVRVIGERWSARCHEIRDLLERYRVPFTFHALDAPDGQALLDDLGVERASCPVLVLADGRVLRDPTNADAADALGANTDDVDGAFDVAVVGAGPAGLASAVYAASEGLRTLVIEREAIGGQAGTTSRIRNYLGFPRGISGGDLARRSYEQAWHFGASFRLLRETLGLRPGFPYHVLTLSDGREIRARAVVVATGVAYRRLGVPSLDGLVGRGVFYGPAMSEAAAMASKPVLVVGGGNSAGQAAVNLAGYASEVTVLVRGHSLAASMSDYLVKEIEVARNIEVRYGTEAVAGAGEHHLEEVVVRDGAGTHQRVRASGLFVLIGGEPRAAWLPREVRRCPRGYVVTGVDLSGHLAGEALLACPQWPSGPLPLETSVPGVFAVGDVRHRSVKRIASAAGEGAMAVALVHEHLARPSSPALEGAN